MRQSISTQHSYGAVYFRVQSKENGPLTPFSNTLLALDTSIIKLCVDKIFINRYQ